MASEQRHSIALLHEIDRLLTEAEDLVARLEQRGARPAERLRVAAAPGRAASPAQLVAAPAAHRSPDRGLPPAPVPPVRAPAPSPVRAQVPLRAAAQRSAVRVAPPAAAGPRVAPLLSDPEEQWNVPASQGDIDYAGIGASRAQVIDLTAGGMRVSSEEYAAEVDDSYRPPPPKRRVIEPERFSGYRIGDDNQAFFANLTPSSATTYLRMREQKAEDGFDQFGSNEDLNYAASNEEVRRKLVREWADKGLLDPRGYHDVAAIVAYLRATKGTGFNTLTNFPAAIKRARDIWLKEYAAKK